MKNNRLELEEKLYMLAIEQKLVPENAVLSKIDIEAQVDEPVRIKSEFIIV